MILYRPFYTKTDEGPAPFTIKHDFHIGEIVGPLGGSKHAIILFREALICNSQGDGRISQRRRNKQLTEVIEKCLRGLWTDNLLIAEPLSRLYADMVKNCEFSEVKLQKAKDYLTKCYIREKNYPPLSDCLGRIKTEGSYFLMVD